MQNVNIVFDTNAYRNLTLGLTEQQTIDLFDIIRNAEDAKSITSILSAVTLLFL